MPYKKILELVESNRLNITAVSLAKITEDFIKYLDDLRSKIKPSLLSDFIVVAAQLLLIKSKVLLPNLLLDKEDEVGIKDLENKLKIYQQYQKAIKNVSGLWRNGGKQYARPYLRNQPNIFYPGNLNLKLALISIKTVFQEWRKVEINYQPAKAKVISLEKRIKELSLCLQKTPAISFDAVIENSSRDEIIMTFLALLHLLKSQTVSVCQTNIFDKIKIKSNCV